MSRGSGTALYALMLCTVPFLSSACQSKGEGDQSSAARGVIVVNAPAAGEVRRVLVSEGMTINEGAPVVEIAVRTEAQGAVAQATAEDPRVRAGRIVTAAQGEIEAARSEVVRTEVEVQRLTPLVASGGATQGQLDGARAEYERAQQRLQRGQTAAQEAQSGLVAARQPARNPPPAGGALPAERIVTATAPSAGTVSAVSARAGQRVTAGQPLATLRADQR